MFHLNIHKCFGYRGKQLIYFCLKKENKTQKENHVVKKMFNQLICLSNVDSVRSVTAA